MSKPNPLIQLHAQGQSFWWDTLSRRLLDDGTLVRMRDKEGMRGVTSNPAIFQSSIAKTSDYDEAIVAAAAEGLDAEASFWKLAVEDIQRSCSVLHPVYDLSEGKDGYVSLEVSPHLAHDTVETLKQARELWARVDRPNLMVKIPATPQGVPAIHQALAEGININVTLLFSTQAHIDVMDAYLDAIEERVARGQAVDRIASVASFFISRVDSMIDSKLEAIGSDEAGALLGRAGIANAKVAYANFEECFSGERWERLAAAGARVQRPLWASTSTKNPAYRDVIYVEELIGPHTVNTMPTTTVDAFRDHGEVKAESVREGVRDARAELATLEALGVNLVDSTEQLLKEGVEKFEASFVDLLGAMREKAGKLAAG